MRLESVFCPQCGVSAPVAAADPYPPKRGFPIRAVSLIAAALGLAGAGYLGWSYVNNTGVFTPDPLHSIELLAANENGRHVLFHAQSDRAASPDAILAKAQAHCRKQSEVANAGVRGSDASCSIAINRVNPHEPVAYPIGRTYEDALAIVGKKWVSDQIFAFYVWDPDNGSTPNRADEIFVLNCKAFDGQKLSTGVVCKGSEQDTLSRELERAARGKRPEANAVANQTIEADAAATDAAVAATDAAVVAAGYGTFHVVADANLRSRATATSSNFGKISRGTVLQGVMVVGEDGESNWLQLADGRGYVSSVNTSHIAPPRLTTILGERRFRPPYDLQLRATPSEQGPVIDTVPAGTVLVLTGITENGFAEAKGRSGGVGYFPAAGYDFSR
jgi:hypothetical protein